jgi:DnaJ-domain-containing protein 1
LRASQDFKIESFFPVWYIDVVGVFDRFGNVLRSYFNDDVWQDARNTGRGFSSNPDLDSAFDELEEFLRGKVPFAGGENRDFYRSTGGNRAKPAIPDALRADFAELGLEFGADAGQCKAAHKRLLKIHHPDRHASHAGNMKKATVKSARINAAYERICRWRETGTV